MPLHIPPGYAQVSVEHWMVNYTRPAVTTWGVKILGMSDLGPVGMANSFQSEYLDAFGNQIDTGTTIRNTRIVIGQDAVDPLVGVANTSGSGSSTRESTAPALALMIHRETGLGGRRNRSRCYFPWALSDQNVSELGAVASGALTIWQTNCNNFLDNIESSELFDFLCVLHSDTLAIPTPITSMQPDPVIRTQKQRQARF